MDAFFIVCFIALFLSACGSTGKKESSKVTEKEGDIWFYRVNSSGQQTVLTVVKNTKLPGCHNLFAKSRLHRIAVRGFEYCEVFTEKNCQANSQLTAQWQAKRKKSADKLLPTTKFTKGTRWVFDPAGNVKARSWRCS